MSRKFRPDLREARRITLEHGGHVGADGGEWYFTAPGMPMVRAHYKPGVVNVNVQSWLKRLQRQTGKGV